MKILIIGTPRSGTTTLMNAIAYGLKYRPLNEPFNPKLEHNEYSPEMTNIVLKTLSHHLTFDKLDNLVKEFDITILLSRKDRNAAWESECNANLRKKEIVDKNGYYNGFEMWHESYVHNPNSIDVTLKDRIELKMDNLVNYSYHSKLPIIWYEDLYSKDYTTARESFEGLNLGITYDDVFLYMNPTKKYRKDTYTLF
jgi:hypothetical protein